MASKRPLTVMSHDPEIIALQAVIKGISHFEKKSLTSFHLSLVAAVEMSLKAFKLEPTLVNIAAILGRDPEDIKPMIDTLVEKKYILEKWERYGELEIKYVRGPAGGTALRSILAPTRRRKKDEHSTA